MKFRTTELRNQKEVDFFEDVIFANKEIQKNLIKFKFVLLYVY